MRWSSLLATAVTLTVVSVATADDFGNYRPTRRSVQAVSNPFISPAGDYYAGSVRASSFTDFPAYPIGFTNYRGLGFWGTCCEKNPPGTEHVWDGYCAQKGRGCAQKGCGCMQKGCGCAQKGCDCCQKPRHSGLNLLGGGLFKQGKPKGHCGGKMDCCCQPACCDPCCQPYCGNVGATWWRAMPPCHKRSKKPLGGKVRRFHDQCSDWLSSCFSDDSCKGCQTEYAPSPMLTDPTPTAPMPTVPMQVEPANPTPAVPKPVPPTPETSIDLSDELPPLSPLDKSARRLDLRRLPAVSVTY